MAYERFVEDGRADEVLVARSVVSALGGSVEWATRYEDTEQHVDFWWRVPDKSHPGLLAIIGVDVKGMRKIRREDAAPSNDITWLETRNVNGKPGSLYGKASYIAFVRIGKILLVNREKLLAFALEKIAGKTVSTDRPSCCYAPYSRVKSGRNDLVFMARLDDIEAIAEHIVPIAPQG